MATESGVPYQRFNKSLSSWLCATSEKSWYFVE
jgi:hypothetical protein